MTLLLQFLRYNDLFAPVLALSGNILLLYLILSVNKAALKTVSFVLLPNCLLDMILSIVTFAMAPQIFNVKFNAYIVVGNPFNPFGFIGASILMWIFASVLITNMNGICIPFYLRYIVLCRDVKSITFKHIFLPYFILFIVFIVLFCGFSWCFPATSETDMELRAPTLSSFWLEEYKNGPIFVSAKIDSHAFIITYSFVIFTTALNYSLVIFFSIKITRTLHSHVINFKDSKIYGKQLHKTLIIQAIGPLLVANVPILSLIAMLFLKVENVVLSLVFSFFLGWIPIVNPLAAMLIITPYRTKIKNIFSKLNATTTTS